MEGQAGVGSCMVVDAPQAALAWTSNYGKKVDVDELERLAFLRQLRRVVPWPWNGCGWAVYGLDPPMPLYDQGSSARPLARPLLEAPAIH